MRLLSFLLLAGAIFVLGRHVPVVGGLWVRLPVLALLGSAMLAAVILERFGQAAQVRRRARAQIADLSAVDTPAQRAKLGTALLAAGKPRQALEPLAEALAAQPDNLELAWRRGQALLRLGRTRDAIEALRATIERDPELGYGQAQLDLAEACRRLGEWRRGLDALETFERNHGASFVSAYERGRLHRGAGERALAREAFGEVSDLARTAPKYQRGQAGWFALRAALLRLV